MKKLIALFVAILMLASLAACGSEAYYEAKELKKNLKSNGYSVSVEDDEDEMEDFLSDTKKGLKNEGIKVNFKDISDPIATISASKSSSNKYQTIEIILFESASDAEAFISAMKDGIEKTLEDYADEEDMDLDELLDEEGYDSIDEAIEERMGIMGTDGNAAYIGTKKAIKDAFEASEDDEDEDEVECDFCGDTISGKQYTVKAYGEKMTVCKDCYDYLDN